MSLRGREIAELCKNKPDNIPRPLSLRLVVNKSIFSNLGKRKGRKVLKYLIRDQRKMVLQTNDAQGFPVLRF
jgi:hypothetical protein